MFVKCDDSACCKPMRSSLKKLFPKGFLPPPVAVERCEGGGFKLLEPSKVDPKMRLVDPLLALAMGIHIEDIPYDLHMPSARVHIPKRTCPVCHQYFPSKAQMERHRVALHYRTRQRLPGDYEEKLTEFDPSEVSLVYGRSDNMYKVILANGLSDVMSLASDHPAVQDFVKTCEANDVSFSVFEYWLQNIQEYM